MFAREAVVGRSLVVVLEPGDEVRAGIAEACRTAAIGSAYVPVFLGAFSETMLIGAEHPPADVDDPMPTSVTVVNAEGHGTATVTPGAEGPEVHLHATVGAKGDSARASAGHVISAVVQYPTEVIVVELVSPALARRPNEAARGIATLTFDDD
jgi:predicted DNA-binding protein with PD1-like motif